MKKNYTTRQQYRLITFLIVIVLNPLPVWSCTIFCVMDKHGNMWAGNNEDFYWFDFSTQVRVVPRTDSALAFIYFNYNNRNFPQGGVNEAGLFFDANMVEASRIKDADKKMDFPGETSELILYMLGHCKFVPEALALFDKYKIPALETGQIHLADRAGNMGIITADSSWLTPGNFQVSTNYNLSHKDDDYKRCWRYPIAHSMLSTGDAGLALMTSICDSTSQRKRVSTIYSNVHNLTTGEMWFYFGWDYENPYQTTFDKMIALGDTVIMIRDLFADQALVEAYYAFKAKGFNEGVELLTTIVDPALRQEKFKLLAQGALFDFDVFVATGKVSITKNEQLIREIIEASNDEEVLSMVSRQDISKANRTLVEQKLRAFRK